MAPNSLADLKALGALDTLCQECNIDLERSAHDSTPSLQVHVDTNVALHKLPTLLQLHAINLIIARRRGEAVYCPICRCALISAPLFRHSLLTLLAAPLRSPQRRLCRPARAFPIWREHMKDDDQVALDICEHIAAHYEGRWDEAEGRQIAREGSCFAVSASMLGGFFDSRMCKRQLHRKSRRIEGGGREEDTEGLVDFLRRAHTTRGEDFEDTIAAHLQLEGEGLPEAWDSFSSADATAAAATAAAAVTGGRRIVFVDATFDESPSGADSPNAGLFIDLKKRAQRRCGCADCRAAVPLPPPEEPTTVQQPRNEQTSCRLYTQAFGEASREALEASYAQPVILYQLQLRPPRKQAREYTAFWSTLLGEARCSDPFLVDGADGQGEPKDVSFSRSFLDYLLLMPRGWNGHRLASPPSHELTATIIDAKATDRVKLGAKVQVTFYSLVLEASLALIGKLSGHPGMVRMPDLLRSPSPDLLSPPSCPSPHQAPFVFCFLSSSLSLWSLRVAPSGWLPPAGRRRKRPSRSR